MALVFETLQPLGISLGINLKDPSQNAFNISIDDCMGVSKCNT